MIRKWKPFPISKISLHPFQTRIFIEDLGPTPTLRIDDPTFSPHQMVPSPVMFGSLPSLVQTGAPWNTLLFRPDLTEGGTHFGAPGNGIDSLGASLTDDALPGDHLWLDAFWMPVVEPYAISENFETAGKVNLNHEIFPFTYIERTTALRAVMKSERMLAIPITAAIYL